MNIIQLAPSKLKDYSNNARKHPAQQIAQLIHSIEEFGFNVPVECNANFVILSGHARVEAAKKMGLATIPVIVQHHLADDTKQKGYILAANKIAMNAEWDTELLISELEELRNAPDFDMSLTGFSDEELNEMLGNMDLLENSSSTKNEEYKAVYEVVLELSDEQEQEYWYNRLQEEGVKCRVLSM